MKHIPALDGIRAVAILGVLIFHVWPKRLKGGFTGVDVFFVLSGYLITSIMLPPMREGRFSLGDFFAKRIQRLAPNVIVTTLATVALWTFSMSVIEAAQVWRHSIWTLLNGSNFFAWKQLGGYWGDGVELAPLAHTWSLGVEEQFYLVYPFALLLLVRLVPGRVRGGLVVATVLGFALCALATPEYPLGSFYLLPTRLWELLAGGALAASAGGGALSAARRELLSWTGLALVVAGYGVIRENQGFPGWVAAIPVAGTLLLIYTVRGGEGILARALSWGPLVGIGKLSYSLYLWHWPLITWGRLQAERSGMKARHGAELGLLASFAAAALVYWFVERPLREKEPAGRARRLGIAGGLFAAAMAWSCLALSRPVLVDPEGRFDPPQFRGVLYSAWPRSAADGEKAVRYHDVQFPETVDIPPEPWKRGGILRPHGGGTPRVVVLGSSHAIMYSGLIDELCRERGVSAAFFEDRPNNDGDLGSFDQARRRWLSEWRPHTLFVIDRWDRYTKDFEAMLRRFLDEVSPWSRRVVFVAQVPAAALGDSVNLREWVCGRIGPGGELPLMKLNGGEAVRQAATAAAERIAAEGKGLVVLRPDRAFLRPDGTLRYAEGRRFFYADDDHLAETGTQEVRGLFEAVVAEVPRQP